ncbi:hypothetical protein SLA2020_046740 [Shorea laevis]
MSNFGFLPTNIPHYPNPIFSLDHDHHHQRYFQLSNYDQMLTQGSEEDNTIGFNAYHSQNEHVKPQEIIWNTPVRRASELPWSRSEVQEEENGDLSCRIAFRTESDVEIMDDGFKWTKYGKKNVKNSPYPR